MRAESVIVVGAGPAGSATAIALARAGLHVTLLAWQTKSRQRVVESLPPTARPLLRRLGAWDAFLATDPSPSPGNLSLWGDTVPRATDFIFNPHGCGWHIDRTRFDAMLRDQARSMGAGICDGRATRVRYETGRWHLLVENSAGALDDISASFLIWAAGRKTPLPAAFGTTRRTLDSLVAIAAFTNGAADTSDKRTWIETVRDGWWYSVPTPAGRQLLAFMTDADLVSIHHRAAWWREGLNATVLTRKRGATFSVSPNTFSLVASTSMTERVAGDTWAVVGDAAIALDPLSSSGITFALASGMRAAEELTGSITPGYFAKWTAATADNYLAQHHARCTKESRWPESPFWYRRHGAVIL